MLEFGSLTVVVHRSLGKKNLGIESFEIKKERVKKKQASCVADKLIDICNKGLVRKKIQIQQPPLLQTKSTAECPPKNPPQFETNSNLPPDYASLQTKYHDYQIRGAYG